MSSPPSFVILQHPPTHGAQFAYGHPGGGQLVGYQNSIDAEDATGPQPLRIKLINCDDLPNESMTVTLTCVQESENTIHPNLVYKWDAETIFHKVRLKDEGRYGSIRQDGDGRHKKVFDLWFKIQRKPARPRGTVGGTDGDAVRIKILVEIIEKTAEHYGQSLSIGEVCTLPLYNKYSEDCSLLLVNQLTSSSGQPGQRATVAVRKNKKIDGGAGSAAPLLFEPVEKLDIYFVDSAGHKVSLPNLVIQNFEDNTSIFTYTVPSIDSFQGLVDNCAIVRVRQVDGKAYAAFRFNFNKKKFETSQMADNCYPGSDVYQINQLDASSD